MRFVQKLQKFFNFQERGLLFFTWIARKKTTSCALNQTSHIRARLCVHTMFQPRNSIKNWPGFTHLWSNSHEPIFFWPRSNSGAHSCCGQLQNTYCCNWWRSIIVLQMCLKQPTTCTSGLKNWCLRFNFKSIDVWRVPILLELLDNESTRAA